MDITNYVCPKNGAKYRIFGLGDEHCQSVLMPDGGIDFYKNRHYEAFFLDNDYIYRAEDTSMISNDGVNPIGTYYVQNTFDGTKLKYGARWIPRQFNVGQTYIRSPYITIHKYTGALIVAYPDVTTITFREYHPTYTFPSKITLSKVIELTWTGEESYLYAEGYGLVGWKNIRTNKEGSWIGAFGADIKPHFPVPVTRVIPKNMTLKVRTSDKVLRLVEALR